MGYVEFGRSRLNGIGIRRDSKIWERYGPAPMGWANNTLNIWFNMPS